MNYTKKILTAVVLGAALVVALGMQSTAQTTTLSCAPTSQTVALNQSANIAVVGGNGTFTFSGSGFATTTTSQSIFSVGFATSGPQTVIVTSGSQSVNCTVNVSTSTTQSAVQCNAPATVTAGQSATYVATGGNGTYTWSATNATLTNPTGAALQLTYPSSGTQTITVSSGGQSSSCVVSVLPVAAGTLACAPANQNVLVGQTATLTATGGTGSYLWSGAGLVLNNPTGTTFNVTYNQAGPHVVTVTSGTQTANCTVTAAAVSTPGGNGTPGLPNTGFEPGL